MQRPESTYPQLVLLALDAPIHPSWLNQVARFISLYSSGGFDAQRFSEPGRSGRANLDFQYYWESAAKPFEWKFTRQDLNELLAKLNTPR